MYLFILRQLWNEFFQTRQREIQTFSILKENKPKLQYPLQLIPLMTSDVMQDRKILLLCPPSCAAILKTGRYYGGKVYPVSLTTRAYYKISR